MSGSTPAATRNFRGNCCPRCVWVLAVTRRNLQRREGAPVSDNQCDALVFFGATGDLAYKKIFPSLQAMIKRGTLNIPIIGVAKNGWSLDQLRERARDSLEHHGGIDKAAFARLIELLRYIDGGYEDLDTFKLLKKALGADDRPAHYLAIPPTLFGTVVEHMAAAGCEPAGARVVVEKPFGRDLASARA